VTASALAPSNLGLSSESADPRATGASGTAGDLRLATESPLAPRSHPLGSPSANEVDGYAIGIGPILDFADGWDCENGAECKNRAVVGELFRTEREARLAVSAYVARLCGKIFPWPRDRGYRVLSEIDGMEPVHIVRVKGTVADCYDYRELGCRVKDAFEQLSLGEGQGEAWHRVREHRSLYGAHAARLPGQTSEGQLFAFLTACEAVEMTSVGKVYPSAP
jgi:hypothetical protein